MPKPVKIAVIVIFPLLAACFAGAVLQFTLWSGGLLLLSDKFTLYQLWDKAPQLGMAHDVANGACYWLFFYAGVLFISRREKWFDRLYEFSKPLAILVPFGIGVLWVSIAHRADGGFLAFVYSGFGVSFWLLILFFLPLVLGQVAALGLVVYDDEKHNVVVSLLYAYAVFFFAPLFVIYLVNNHVLPLLG